MSNFLSTTQPGLLSSTSLQAASFSSMQADFYVDGTYGFDGNPGTSPGLAFRTFTPLSYQLPLWRKNNNYNQLITVAFSGVVSQQWTAPKVNDVSIVGAAGLPRQATTSSVPNGSGATWLSPTNLSNTAALIVVQGQGWTLDNIFFNNAATTAPCVQVLTDGTGDPPVDADGAHFLLKNCILTGTDDGFQASGGTNWVTLDRNTFFGFSGAGDLAISNTAGAGIGTLVFWKITNNSFLGNTGHITAPLSGAEIANNRFSYIFNGTTSTTQVVLTSGKDNSVHHNHFDIPYNTNGISAMFALGTNDRWGPNSFSTAVTTTIFSFGQPVS